MRTTLPRAARRRPLAWLCAVCCGAALPAAAQTAYPERPVRIVSISSAGTGVDDFTRLAAKYFSERTGKSFFVENRPGANGIIATDHVAKAAPDGYTILLTAASAITANPYMYRSLPYDPNKDLAPVARMSVVPIVVTVPARSPHKSLDALLQAARAQPGKLSYGTSTAGYKVMVAAVNALAKVHAVEVPYKGTTTLLPDLMSGTLDYAMVEISQVVPQMQAGKLRPLAVSSPARVAAPPAIVRQLSDLALEFVASAEAKAHFDQRGTAAYPAAHDSFRQDIVQDQARWKHYIAAAGLQPE